MGPCACSLPRLKRESLKFDPRVRGVLVSIWLLYDEDGNGQIDKVEYITTSRLVQKVRCCERPTEGSRSRRQPASEAEEGWQEGQGVGGSGQVGARKGPRARNGCGVDRRCHQSPPEKSTGGD